MERTDATTQHRADPVPHFFESDVQSRDIGSGAVRGRADRRNAICPAWRLLRSWNSQRWIFPREYPVPQSQPASTKSHFGKSQSIVDSAENGDNTARQQPRSLIGQPNRSKQNFNKPDRCNDQTGHRKWTTSAWIAAADRIDKSDWHEASRWH
jgi:hypothetical protein